MPRLNKETIKRIMELGEPMDGSEHLNGKQIFHRLQSENLKDGAGWIITTTPRPIQTRLKNARELLAKGMGPDNQPWTLVLSHKVGIPYDPILLRLLRLWFRQQIERGQGRPFVPFPVGIAKWAVRLHKVAPYLVEEGEHQLLYRAKQYFAMERMAILAGKAPDSSYDDLEIAMKEESDQGVQATYEAFCGSTLQLEGQNVEVEDCEGNNIAVSEIEVPVDIVPKIKTNKRKGGLRHERTH